MVQEQLFMNAATKILITLTLLILVAAAYMRFGPTTITNMQEKGTIAALAKGDMARLDLPEAPYPLEDYILMLEDDSPVRLSEMRGKILLVNIWASYCAPCQYEMKDLNALQVALGGADFEVVAINTDRGGVRVARETLIEWDVPDLKLYADPKMNTAFGLAEGRLPTSLIVDRDGMVLASYTGPLDWADDDALAMFTALMRR